MRFLFLLFILAGCSTSTHSSYQQTARPAVYRPPPVNTPGYYPGTPAEPVYTPNGAGLPGERVPGTGYNVPRSPNKRILPPTKEPGLWAADEVRAASSIIQVNVGVLPYELDVPLDGVSAGVINLCSQGLSQGWADSDDRRKISDDVDELSRQERACLAAWLISDCIQQYTSKEGEPDRLRILKELLRRAEQREEEACHGLPKGKMTNTYSRIKKGNAYRP